MIMLGIFCGLVMMGTQPVMAEMDGRYNKLCESSISEELKKKAGCEVKKQLPEVAASLFQWAIGLIGLAGVITIIVSGQRMISAEGDAGKVKQARIMLVYGVAGIIVATMAFAIVNFVMGNI